MSFEGMVSLRPALPVRLAETVPLGELARATFEETLVTNPTAAYLREQRLRGAYESTGEQVDAVRAREELKANGLEGQLNIPDQGISRLALTMLMDRKREEMKRAAVFAKAPQTAGATALKLAVALGGSLLDPLNIASGFVPVVGEARYAQLLGKGAGVLRRTTVRAGVGAVEGTAGAAALEPLISSSKALDQADYDMADSLANIAFGGVFGAGLHVMGGAGADVFRYARGSAGDVAAAVRPETRSAALKTAVAQSAGGERVNVEPLVKLDSRSDPDPFKTPVTFEERIADTYFRDHLTIMRNETGWSEVGGRILRAPQYEGDPNAPVIGRTPWIPRAEWWPDRPAGLSEKEVHKAIDKALAGEKLGKRQQELIEFMFDVAEQRRAIEPFAATVDELRAAGAPENADASMEAGLVVRASEIDEAAVERAAIQYDNDPDAFLRAIREIAGERQVADGGGAPGARASPLESRAVSGQETPQVRLAAVRTAADAPKLSTVADERASAAADEALEAAPTDDLQALQEETDAILAELRETHGDDLADAMADSDLTTKDAETYTRAARAAVLCGMGHA